MPLKPCRECGHQVSTEATKCPQCGVALKEGILEVIAGRKRGSPLEVNWSLRITVVFVILVVALIVWILAQR